MGAPVPFQFADGFTPVHRRLIFFIILLRSEKKCQVLQLVAGLPSGGYGNTHGRWLVRWYCYRAKRGKVDRCSLNGYHSLSSCWQSHWVCNIGWRSYCCVRYFFLSLAPSVADSPRELESLQYPMIIGEQWEC